MNDVDDVEICVVQNNNNKKEKSKEGGRDNNKKMGGKEEGLPPGFRFHPTDEELITAYLINKISDPSFSARAITDVDLNKCEPWELPGTYNTYIYIHIYTYINIFIYMHAFLFLLDFS